MLIQQFAQTRAIRELLHFTRAENLPSILRRGLLTRSVINHARTVEIFNDELRLDGTDAICVSIGFPNYKMFYRMRAANPDFEWVVISINPSALWNLRCAFCKTNAASSSVTATPLINRTTLSAFQAMYENFGNLSRATLTLPDAWPTNPQAEVLFLDGVPREYFMGVYTENAQQRDRYTARNMDIQFKANPINFSPRSDYKHWRNG